MSALAAIREFSNVGRLNGGRMFPGFPDRSGLSQWTLGPRDAVSMVLRAGDVLMFGGGPATLRLVAFDDRGADASPALGLTPAAPVAVEDFDAAAFTGWLGSHGVTDTSPVRCAEADVGRGAEPLVLRAQSECTLWIINPARPGDLVGGGGHGAVTVSRQRPAGATPLLPDPLGHIREEFTVRRGTARAYELRAGEFAQIIDIEGQQCSDFQAARASALDAGAEAFIDTTATRSMVRRAYPGPGLFDKFYDAGLAPMMRVVQDTCGRHDTFGMACTARGYEDRGFPGHVNCSDNISSALEPYGVRRRAAWPAINFFWNTWLGGTHELLTEESHSRPGDFVVLEALSDLVCVSTACPDDIDPINGWNPTDVHVRIYEPTPRPPRAVAYRPTEDAAMLSSRESPFHPKLQSLTRNFAPARDLWAAVEFPATGVLGEYWACRERVTLQDMSALRKFDIVGPDAERLLQLALTRDVARLPLWRGTYALMCDEAGTVIDDGTLFHVGPHLYRWCCGSEESGRWLTALADEHGLQVRINDMRNALPSLSLQGPKSRDLLREIVFTQPHVPALGDLKWFGATVARLNDRDGAPFMLTRTGYTGELGYEIFCAGSDALEIWDALMTAGVPFGLEPMGTTALNLLRVEAGLAAAGAEFAPGVDALEAGLGFAVNFKKSEFVGKDALARNSGAPRRRLVGLTFRSDDVPRHAAPVFAGERQVGEITSAVRSPMLERAIAMARVAIEHADEGQELEVGQLDGRMKRLTAAVVPVPFVDPERKRARA